MLNSDINKSRDKGEDNPKDEMIQIFRSYLYSTQPDGSPAVNISDEEKAERLKNFKAEIDALP